MGAIERLRIEQLELELDEALERIRQLENIELGRGWICPLELQLTPAMQRLLAALVAQERCTKEFLHAASVDAGRVTDTEIKIVDVWICKMRPKLRHHGIQIETVWGSGYALRPEDRERLRHWPPNPPKQGEADQRRVAG